MNYLTKQLQLRHGDVVEVEIDRSANVRLFDDSNYRAFQRNQVHRFWGGGFTAGKVPLPVPRDGTFHLVIDLGSQGGSIRHTVRVRRARAA